MAHRRPQRPRAARNLVVDGSLVRKGETLPRSVPTRDVDRLGMHGMVDRRKGDKHIGDTR